MESVRFFIGRIRRRRPDKGARPIRASIFDGGGGNAMMEYKGYIGKVEFDDDALIFHGEVINTRDVITFQGESVAELKKAFRESIDDYLAFCSSRVARSRIVPSPVSLSREFPRTSPPSKSCCST